jgi:hypothetical protein
VNDHGWHEAIRQDLSIELLLLPSHDHPKEATANGDPITRLANSLG